MRSSLLVAMTMLTAFGTGAADAQRVGGYPGAPYPMPGQAIPRPRPPVGMQPGQPLPAQSRWGGTVGGRWYGGVNAPGGWNAYRRPTRGYRLPSYWTGASFFIGDFAGYGLSAPPPGYRWYRYYDDAVLVDDGGRVYDSVYGLDWNGGYGGAGGYASDGYAYAQGGAGGYGQSYQQTYAQPLPPVQYGNGVTTYSTSSGYPAPQGGYSVNGYYYPPQTTTVVTVQSAPTVTTTTEYVEETTTGTRDRSRYVAPRRVVYRAAPRRVVRSCGCTRIVRVPVRPRRHPVEEVVQGS